MEGFINLIIYVIILTLVSSILFYLKAEVGLYDISLGLFVLKVFRR